MNSVQSVPDPGGAVGGGFPIIVAMQAAPINDVQAKITATVTSTVELNDVTLEIVPTPELTIVANEIPKSFALKKVTMQQYTFVVESKVTYTTRLDIRASATFRKEPIGALAVIFLGQRAKQLAQIAEPEAQRCVEDRQAKSTPDDGSGSFNLTIPEPGTPEWKQPLRPQPAPTCGDEKPKMMPTPTAIASAGVPEVAPGETAPSDVSATTQRPILTASLPNMTLTGAFRYIDHLTTPDRGTLSTGSPHPIRRARVTLVEWANNQNYPLAQTYSDDNGAYQFNVSNVTATVFACTRLYRWARY